jgi:integral membrane protein
VHTQKLYQSYKSFRPFTNQEAWFLFRVAAIGEAVGWSLLIAGITTERFLWHSHIPVTLAGRFHGTLFLIYIVAAVLLSPSLGWSFPRTVLAGLCSVPPYGSLIFEKIIGHSRSTTAFQGLHSMVSYKLLTTPKV